MVVTATVVVTVAVVMVLRVTMKTTESLGLRRSVQYGTALSHLSPTKCFDRGLSTVDRSQWHTSRSYGMGQGYETSKVQLWDPGPTFREIISQGSMTMNILHRSITMDIPSGVDH